ncbi:hypothetical protein [Clostridium perfringens]|uniref:hypothetical protein n=1 Tax=Clostridium perfringens TaxID=1502 RepID=UPI001A2847BE|nr:hypothetical protein CPBEC5_00570 [Clostridium perfringens]STB10676.1 Uncharacterised protein [Clostridium novyi]HAT4315418.1 hypothetical protein [Clostridium perfringens]HCG3019775.1 hypothetical protein [Clostridium perfringens]
MAYTVQSSEKLRPSAADTETKAMLYLMNFRNDSNEIYYFVVDFFNDLTGMNRFTDRMWDLQSKGDKSPSPYTIGTELVTLYKNYVSEFNFDFYIVFLGGVTGTLRKDSNLTEFDINNIKDDALKKLKQGLKNECSKKTYINNNDITDDRINTFLDKVYFIINNKEKSDYIKGIIKLNPLIIPETEKLNGIFNEIRDMQASKKHISVVEGKIIHSPDESLNYGRHLTTQEIKLLVLNRILNQNVLDSKVPFSFYNIYIQFPEEKRRAMLEDCKLDLSRALFNVNCSDVFWKLLDNIYMVVSSNPKYDVNTLYKNLDKRIINNCIDFNTLSLKYFISLVKDGIE